MMLFFQVTIREWQFYTHLHYVRAYSQSPKDAWLTESVSSNEESGVMAWAGCVHSWVSLCSPSGPGACFVGQAGLALFLYRKAKA